MARPATETRRALQPLWSALDAHLAPRLTGGALLCVSGGLDSRALLESVARWPGRFAGELAVACVDHHTRAESAAEAGAVVARASALAFAAHRLEVAPASGGEGSLREARYRSLAALARRLDLRTLVVAHHAGDVAEAAALSWLGSGGGPGGAAPPRVSDRDGVTVVRPFLELPRSTLRAALAAVGALDFFLDPDATSARARVRSRLASIAGDADLAPRLAQAAVRRREDEDVLVAVASGLLVEHEGATEVRGPAPPALFRRALEEAVRRRAGRDPRRAAQGVATALRLLARGRPGRVDLVGATLEVTRSGVATVTPAAPAGEGAVAGRPGPTHDAGEASTDTALSAAASLPRVDKASRPDAPTEPDAQEPPDEPDEQDEKP